jgi:glycogen operon protein
MKLSVDEELMMTNTQNTCLNPYPLGVHKEGEAVRFSFVPGADFHSGSGTKRENCGVILYDRKTGKKIKRLPYAPDERIGNIYCKYVTDINAEETAYQFYEGDNIVPDRYARRFVGNSVYGKEHKIQSWRAILPTTSAENFDWKGDRCPRIPYSESICYCAHVRGFTRHASSGVAHRGTFLGMVEKLDYLQESGITTVELQPAYEFSEMPNEMERKALLAAQKASYMTSVADLDMIFPKKCNYWGYKQGYYYAPKAAYAAGDDPCTEYKEMVRAFHSRNMEVVMQFYFPKTVNALEITEILRFWVLEYHVDGFHLMGENLPVDLIASDAMLADTKLWYYYFNTEQLYDGEERPAYRNLAVYTDDYLYTMRKFLKGDENMLDDVLTQMRRIPDKTGQIHYLSNYYGFTMMDMVSYDRKHNEMNGEDNRDGNDYNCSWNCGEEGPSRKKKVQALRRKQLKNAMVLLLFGQSTPLIFMGDEFGNSQKGNNNPYCQDNAVTWLNWNDLQKNNDIYQFWRELIELRRAHPILHPENELKIMDYISCGYPDLSYHGQNAWQPRTESYNRHIGIMYCGKYAQRSRGVEDDFFYLAMNMYWEDRELAMPKLPKEMKWKLLISTDNRVDDESRTEGAIAVPGRSCAIYVSVPDESEVRKGRRTRTRKVENYSDRTMF